MIIRINGSNSLDVVLMSRKTNLDLVKLCGSDLDEVEIKLEVIQACVVREPLLTRRGILPLVPVHLLRVSWSRWQIT
jgi:hypothetical protein